MVSWTTGSREPICNNSIKVGAARLSALDLEIGVNKRMLVFTIAKISPSELWNYLEMDLLSASLGVVKTGVIDFILQVMKKQIAVLVFISPKTLGHSQNCLNMSSSQQINGACSAVGTGTHRRANLT